VYETDHVPVLGYDPKVYPMHINLAQVIHNLIRPGITPLYHISVLLHEIMMEEGGNHLLSFDVAHICVDHNPGSCQDCIGNIDIYT